MILKIHDSNFAKEVIKENKLVIVDFSAVWCTPCKMIAPILEKIAYENNNIKIVNIDVDKNPRVSNRYRISTIPNIKFFKNGKVIDEIVGFVPKEEIENTIKKYL